MSFVMAFSNAVDASATGAQVGMSTYLSIGLTGGGIFVAVSLIYLLAYLDLLEAGEVANQQIRTMLIASIVPLLLTFGGVILVNALQVI